MTKPKKTDIGADGLNRVQRRALMRIAQRGRGVLLTAPNGRYNLPDGTSTVSANIVRVLIERGFLVDNRDTLFADCRSQTLRVTERISEVRA